MAAFSPPPANNFLGALIKVVTTHGEELEGELFCYDVTTSNSIVLREQLPNGRANYRWVRTNFIREVKASGHGDSRFDEVLPAIDLDKIDERARDREGEYTRLSKTWGVGVTEQAQEVFNAMNKTMECEWDKEDIICFGVRITKPYTPDNCTGGDDPQTLDRVKKVLQGELERLRKKGEKGLSSPRKSVQINDVSGMPPAGKVKNAVEQIEERRKSLAKDDGRRGSEDGGT